MNMDEYPGGEMSSSVAPARPELTMIEAEEPMDRAEMKGARDLTQGPVLKTLVAFALPTLGVNILQTVNGSVNSVWVGRLLGEAALGATANANTVMFLMFSLLFGFSMATTILIGQAAGAKNMDRAKSVLGTSVSFFAIAGILTALVGWFFSTDLLRLLATPADILPLADAYLRVIFLGMPFTFMMILLTGSLRGVGDSVSPLYITVLNVVLDIILCPLLIAGVGPFPEMGIAGAGAATLIAGLVSVFALVWRIYAKSLAIALYRNELHFLKINGTIFKQTAAIGLPMGLSMITVAASAIVMIGLINREGTETVAAFGVMTQLWNYLQMPAFAIGSAVSAMAAQNIGGGRWDRISHITRSGVAINVLMTGLLALVIIISFDPIAGLFLPDGGETLAIARHMDRMVSWTYVLMGASMVFSSVVRANGAMLMPFLILFISAVLVRFAVGYGLYDYFGAEAIWSAFGAGAVAAFALQLLYYNYGNWREKNIRQD